MRLALRTVGVVVLALVAAALLALTSTMTSAFTFAAAVALTMGPTLDPEPDPRYVAAVDQRYIQPLYPGYMSTGLMTPEQFWPLSGFIALTFDNSRYVPQFRPVSGFTDMTFDNSVDQGVTDLNNAITDHSGDSIVVFGYSQSARIATIEKRKLIDQYQGNWASAPDVSFVLIGNPNRPNGGSLERYEGLHIPILGITFDGATPTNSEGNFPTTDYSHQYDTASDAPINPLNLAADLNWGMGLYYSHFDYFSSSVAAPVLQDQYGDTTYYLIPTQTLPLLSPVQQIPGVGPVLADTFDPPLRVIVEAGYDRTISPGEPTRANLLYFPNPIAFVRNLNVATLTGLDNGLQDVIATRPFGTARPDVLGQGAYGIGGPPVTMDPTTNAQNQQQRAATKVAAPAPQPTANTQLTAAAAATQTQPEVPAPKETVATDTPKASEPTVQTGTNSTTPRVTEPTKPSTLLATRPARKIRGPIGSDLPRVKDLAPSIKRAFGGPSTTPAKTADGVNGAGGGQNGSQGGEGGGAAA